MTRIFIAGSRSIRRLDAAVKARLSRIVEQSLPILVGDADGADKAVQEFLSDRQYERVEVFCTGTSCRNNQGSWPIRMITATGQKKRRDFAFYALKDQAMAEEATLGFMLWDGRSVGTLMNVLRLTQRRKKSVVYMASSGEFFEVASARDWESLLERCPAELRERIAQESAKERSPSSKTDNTDQLGLL